MSEINGQVEVMVNSTPGTIQYLDEKIELCAITGVTASLIARKQGISRRLTATRLALDAAYVSATPEVFPIQILTPMFMKNLARN